MTSRNSWVAALVVALGTAFSCSAANILENGDFEADDLQGWRVTQGSTLYRLVVDDVRGQCVEGTETVRAGNLGRLVQSLDGKVTPGETYRLTGWIKTLSVQSDGGVVIGVGAVNADGALVSGSFWKEVGHVKGSSNWKYFESKDIVLPGLTPGAVGYAVYLDFNGNGSGRARFDDVVLTSAKSTSGTLSILQIGGFGLFGLVIVFGGVFLGMWAFKKFERRKPAWQEITQ